MGPLKYSREKTEDKPAVVIIEVIEIMVAGIKITTMVKKKKGDNNKNSNNNSNGINSSNENKNDNNTQELHAFSLLLLNLLRLSGQAGPSNGDRWQF